MKKYKIKVPKQLIKNPDGSKYWTYTTELMTKAEYKRRCK